ncbi:XkdF-like putative serine protease domain-containing protein [Rhizobium leguminosarum]|uniref:XkdF-like putative serine protease domain-containing protein n=1 Tax=Rhizobium leguminosarum TaxID=384 RepID=UPI001AE262E1|nr:XkdF-like putative serine protease domain-containing protein [Rhizobium leguminosarum]MBP2444840.1 hypothetical protein [Rhizobium leguminosarum]
MTAPVRIAKVDRSLGIVFGWTVISTVDGAEFVDSQNDHIPEAVALEAFAKFAAGERTLKLDHTGSSRGTILFIFPLTSDIAASLGIVTKQTGIVIGVKPDDPAILDQFADGRLQGFSIGGRGEIHEVDA